MAINNIKLFESQRLTNEDNSGGRVTGSEVIDCNINVYRMNGHAPQRYHQPNNKLTLNTKHFKGIWRCC